MHRRPLLDLLALHGQVWPEDGDRLERFLHLVHSHSDCLERTCMPGHVTGSAWVVSEGHGHCVLHHHRKLDRWLQPGGHADGDPDILSVALREVREETGLTRLRALPVRGVAAPLDIDIHLIPENAAEPAHEHYDVRFLVEVASGQDLVRSHESKDVRWVPTDHLTRFTTEDSVLRLHRRAAHLIKRVP